MGIRESINAGYPQHAAIVFDGTLDIIGSERILLEDGFTLTQTYCAEENLIPGSIANNHFTARLLNQDGVLKGFDFGREAVLLLGVETGDPVDEDFAGSYNTYTISFMKMYDVYVRLSSQSGGRVQFFNGASLVKTVSSVHNFVAYKHSGACDVYTIGEYDNNVKKLDHHIVISSDNTVTVDTSFVPVEISSVAFNRLENLRNQGKCECWDNDGAATYRQWTWMRSPDGSGYEFTRTDVLYRVKAGFLGETPRSTSDQVVEFTAATDFSFLDQNADDYAKAVWSSSRTLGEVFCQVSGNQYFSSGLLPSGVDSRVLQTNPFAGIEGLTYRDMTSYVCGAVGLIAYPYTDFTIQSGMQFDIYSYFMATTHLSGGSTPSMTLSKDEYYSYSAADYTVHPINKATWKQIYPVSGAFVGEVSYEDGSANPLEYMFVGNPILDNSGSINGLLVGAAFSNIKQNYFGGYNPCNFESHLGALIDPGATIAIVQQDDTTTWMPVFVVTINWNGSAECTVECTGVELYNQNDDPVFKNTIQNANMAYRVADNTGSNSSSYLVKNHIQNLDEAGDILDNLRPVSFRYNFDRDEKTHYGLVFEETQDKLPVICRDDPNPMRKKINYTELIPILLAEVQHLRARVKELEEHKEEHQEGGN